MPLLRYNAYFSIPPDIMLFASSIIQFRYLFEKETLRKPDLHPHSAPLSLARLHSTLTLSETFDFVHWPQIIPSNDSSQKVPALLCLTIYAWKRFSCSSFHLRCLPFTSFGVSATRFAMTVPGCSGLSSFPLACSSMKLAWSLSVM